MSIELGIIAAASRAVERGWNRDIESFACQIQGWSEYYNLPEFHLINSVGFQKMENLVVVSITPMGAYANTAISGV
ncbi:MAG: hypothetical protein JKY48_15255 [Flavobacteriales bacterium]|nr:hypothetical protein [Flavobacteriales bacterium]